MYSMMAIPFLDGPKSSTDKRSTAGTDAEAARLAEELRKEKGELLRAQRELAELKATVIMQRSGDRERMQSLERLMQEAKTSERKMMQQLVQQTKQLQQSKSGVDMAKAEARQTEQRLADTEAELATAVADAARYKSQLESTQAKLETVTGEFERYRAEAEEASSLASEKERVLVEWIKVYEADKSKARQEKVKLTESQRVVREENVRLREVIRQAVSEADAVAESLAVVRDENARLYRALADKDALLEMLQQDYESLKHSEAAAQECLRELNSMLAPTAPPSTCSSSAASPSGSPLDMPPAKAKPRKPNGRRHSFAEGFKFTLEGGAPVPRSERPAFLSRSDTEDIGTCMATEDFDTDCDHTDGGASDDISRMELLAAKKKKKSGMVRKFGGLFRRSRSHKSDLPPSPQLSPYYTNY